jgi:aryl-alcohol dehydrogenase-like predicted oxidoreductase
VETRPLGRGGPEVPVLGICPGEGPLRDAVIRRALDLGAGFFWSAVPVPGALTLSEAGEHGSVRYNLLDQKDANTRIAALAREGRGVVAMHVLGGGLFARGLDARLEPFRGLVRQGRTLLQAAIQFVLANESVTCATVRVSRPDHVDEVLGALAAAPLTGQDLEIIFEAWANRFG